MNSNSALALILILWSCSSVSEEQAAPTYDQRTPEMMIEIQKRLQARGYDPGPVNGKWSNKIQESLFAFMRDEGTIGQEHETRATWDKLGFSCFYVKDTAISLSCPVGCTSYLILT